MISERIKLIRKKTKMSQQEFGKQLGVSRDVIGNLEYGRVEPKEPFITLLCNIFDINKEWLITGNGNMTDKNIASKKNIDDALKILDSLSPELQDYAIQQLHGLAEIQKNLSKQKL